MLEVQSIEHVFPKIRVDINEENEVQATYTGLGIDWNQRGYSVVYPLEIQAKAETEYFMVREIFFNLTLTLTLIYQHYSNVKDSI